MESAMRNGGFKIFMIFVFAAVGLIFGTPAVWAVSQSELMEEIKKSDVDEDTKREMVRQLVDLEKSGLKLDKDEKQEGKDVGLGEDIEHIFTQIDQDKEKMGLTDESAQKLKDMVARGADEKEMGTFFKEQGLKMDHQGDRGEFMKDIQSAAEGSRLEREYDMEQWKDAQTDYEKLIAEGKTHEEAAREVGEKYSRNLPDERSFDPNTPEGRERAIEEFERNRDEMRRWFEPEEVEEMEKAMKEGDMERLQEVTRDATRNMEGRERDRYQEMKEQIGEDKAFENMVREVRDNMGDKEFTPDMEKGYKEWLDQQK